MYTISSSVCCSRPKPVVCLSQVLKVAILAEKYAVDYTWYVDTILNLIRIAGDYVSEEVWYRVIQIVINREDVQGYAAKTVFEVSITIYLYYQCAYSASATSVKCGPPVPAKVLLGTQRTNCRLKALTHQIANKELAVLLSPTSIQNFTANNGVQIASMLFLIFYCHAL